MRRKERFKIHVARGKTAAARGISRRLHEAERNGDRVRGTIIPFWRTRLRKIATPYYFVIRVTQRKGRNGTSMEIDYAKIDFRWSNYRA